MRILYVSQYFPPEIGAPAARVHELARHWARLGHAVTVLTAFAQHPLGVKAPGDRGVLTRREVVDGIDVVRAYIWASANRGVAKRMLSFASFAAAATVIGSVRCARPDVVIATSPQLLCGLAGRLLAARFRVPFVFEVRDLWPESVTAVEAMGKDENVVLRGLRALAAWLYRSARLIVTVGDGYRRQIHERYAIPLAKMEVVPNGVELEFFRPEAEDGGPGAAGAALRRERGWGDDRFVVLTIGALGMAHALHRVLAAARLVAASDPSILFVLAGEGAEKERLRALIAEMQLTNVELADAQPKALMPAWYAAGDAGLVTLRDTPLFRDVLPSKLFEYFAMERPVVLAAEGEPRRLLTAAGAGIAVAPEDAAGMAAAVRALAADPARRREMGRSAREHVARHHDRGVLARRYLEILAAVVGRTTV